MTTRTKNKRLITKILGGIIVFLIISILVYFVGKILFSENRLLKKADLLRLQSEEYQAVFLSMFPIQNYAEEDFATFRGLATVKTSYKLQTLKELSSTIEIVFTSTSNLDTMYIGIDPQQFDFGEDTTHLTAQIQRYLQPTFQNYPGTSFEILLSYPSVSDWNELSAKQKAALIDTYHALAKSLIDYCNVSVYFLGTEEWLIANPANYEDSLLVNTDVSRTILLHTFCDHNYLLTTGNMEATFTNLKKILQKANQPQSVFTDNSDLSVVFFGDSIIGNYTGSLSIPGVVNGFSNARTYNCGFGGISAAYTQADNISFPHVIDAFLQKRPSLLPHNSQAYLGMQEFISDGVQGQQLCFIINFGLNDFFVGTPIVSEDPYDVSTYSGSLRTSVIKLQKEYPEAYILLVTPTFSSYFNNGIEKQGEYGGILTDYVNAVLSLSDELSVDCLNLYECLGINADNHREYLSDGCHLNEMGRYLVGRQIVTHLKLLSQTKQLH